MRTSLVFTLTAALAAVTSAAPIGQNSSSLVVDKCTQPGTFALTFDDGPFEYTWDLAKSLNTQGINATFFMNGNNFIDVENSKTQTSDGEKTYIEVIKYVHDLGHQVASHTYQHKDLPGLTKEEVQYQMNQESDIIFKAIGKRGAKLGDDPSLNELTTLLDMRPPEGALDDQAKAVLAELGYKGIVLWDIDSNDWKKLGIEHEKTEITNVLGSETGNPTGGHISLMHDVWERTAKELVPWAVEYIKSKGYKFQTVAECLGTNDPYL
ncbi:Carbohydrate esterase 4 protein [Apophysomyces ossiformis]|uniref:Carbohydrate esterase 4 protein n=1 Tax=Apophysomyces ossiformis TaxID=679940 RepID=A0A8H7BLC4_9FUNG|nr:Carbohydrate esterase 4 protein [Apophysomyces ossiformis]